MARIALDARYRRLDGGRRPFDHLQEAPAAEIEQPGHAVARIVALRLFEDAPHLNLVDGRRGGADVGKLKHIYL